MNIQQILIQELKNEAQKRPYYTLSTKQEIVGGLQGKYRNYDYTIVIDPWNNNIIQIDHCGTTKIPLEDPQLFEKIWDFIENPHLYAKQSHTSHVD